MNPSLRVRIVLYVACWVATLFAVDVRLFLLGYMFPMGLYAVFMSPGASEPSTGWPIIIGGWALYLGHAAFYFRARESKRFWLLFGVLVLLLSGNVAGCHRMLPAPYG